MKKIGIGFVCCFFPLLFFFLYQGLFLNKKPLSSMLINKPLPNFELPIVALSARARQNDNLSSKKLLGKPFLLTVWASWCVPCIQENALLLQLHLLNKIRMVGIDYKDDFYSAVNWLNKRGNPYDVILEDKKGELGMELGVYGIPESFFVDHKGIIRKKWVGALTQQRIQDELFSLLERG